MKGVPFTHPFTFFLFQIVPFHNKSTTFVNHVCNIQYKMNDNKLKNKTVPFNYARCYNEQCPKACNCLRQVAALLTTADASYISIVNPMCIPATGIDCPHFQNAEKIHVAWGISHLLDNVPYKDGTNIKQQLIGHFGKTLYYRFYREERFLSPADQNYIRQLFHRKGITEEPVFDSYTDEYNW